MCDYSLEQLASRSVLAGDRLVTTAFAGSTTLGFAAAAEPGVVVCLAPGTRIEFAAPAAFSGLFGFLLQAQQHDGLAARFRRVNEDNPLVHHDALEFANGQIVLLTKLKPGQEAVVLQLPAAGNALSGREAVPA